MGRVDLIMNISNRQLTDIETQALSLGLKFDTGTNRKGYNDYVNKNYKWNESDIDKGFKQGVIAYYQALADSERPAIPRRYLKTLQELGKCENIVITHADKGGGVIVMNKNDYVEKMLLLLNDGTTYESKTEGYAKREAEKFKVEARRILRKTERGKKMMSLLEEAPRPPRMYGLPKVHKRDIPMRPITSGIGSAPHKLAKCLAKPLSDTLGSISGAHLRNSSDLIDRLKNLNFKGKKLVSFDVKALFTNVPVDGAMEAVKRVVDNTDENDLPVNKRDYMKLISMCVGFGAFIFNENEYRQHRGLAMGSPLSAVLACLYMEMLESDSFLRIMGRGCTWLRYVDDVLVVMPEQTNVDNKLRMLNNVNNDIQFTVEMENENKIPFLDTLIERSNEEVKFSVYRKPTNRDDFIHYFSAHSERTKTGVVIGFFLRALRICNIEYLDNELNYITEAFKKLKYPNGLLCKLKEKAGEIYRRVNNNEEERTNVNYVTVPMSSKTQSIDRLLTNAGMKIVKSSSTKIGEVIKNKNRRQNGFNNLSVVYKIPCNSCVCAYIGETGRGLEKRIAEHKSDLRAHRTSNSLVVHIDEHGHMPDWRGVEVLYKGAERNMRRTIEAAFINTNKTNNHREGFVCLAKETSQLLLLSINDHLEGRVLRRPER